MKKQLINNAAKMLKTLLLPFLIHLFDFLNLKYYQTFSSRKKSTKINKIYMWNILEDIRLYSFVKCNLVFIKCL